MDLGLKGKVAMVGGASRGLGFAVAQALASEGAIVSISSRNEARSGRGGAGSGGADAGTAVDVKSADATHSAGPRRRSSDSAASICCSPTRGGPPAGPALSFDDAAWQDAANLLLFSTLRMVRAVVPSMTARGGGAILVSTSSSVKEPIPNLGLSTVLRASVSALAKTLSLELAAVEDPRQPDRARPARHRSCPRARRDQRQEAGHLAPQTPRPSRLAAIPMGRYGEPDEFGRVGAFLLSDAAGYITGATVQVDGGLIKSVL